MKKNVSPEQLLEQVREKFGPYLQASGLSLGDPVIRVEGKDLFMVLQTLKEDPIFTMDYFINVTAVDFFDHPEWLDEERVQGKVTERFDVVYHLMSLEKLCRLRVKVAVSEDHCELPSAVPLWAGANFMEREVFDMFGVKFLGHPNLRRILLYEEFQGYPLRKDYPVQAKQPRVRLRMPEVQNTALDMVRPPLVKINKKDKTTPSALFKGNTF